MSAGSESEGPGRVDRWGIQQRYRDADGRWRDAPEETLRALRERIGEERTGEPSAGREVPPSEATGVRVVLEGHAADVGEATIVLEDGTELHTESRLPPDLPLGYHRLLGPDGARTLLISAPRACVPPPEPTWGWAVQVYAARSRESWGIGDFADVRWLADWAARDGAGMLLLSPLGADTPVTPLEPSPYYPSSRRFRNPLHLRVEDVPGASGLGAELERLGAEGRALNRERRIDRDAAWRLKQSALSSIWERVRDSGSAEMSRFSDWRRGRGEALEEFATFCAIAEQHGRGWRSWPSELRRPDGPAVERFARERSDRVGYHAWLQWLCDRQLEGAAGRVPLMQDLPIGVEPGGADAWAWQDLLADGVGVGAPPDAFNPRGQDWGLPPFVPGRLRAVGYRPFIETLRSLLAHGSWARIDHVMGLFRLFWIPPGAEPSEGTYVRYPYEELLAILALESRRANAVIVGEDLGTVEEGVREELARRNVLSYRVLWFEEGAPETWPENAMAAVTTHDLPTVAGVWSGAEIESQRAAGAETREEAVAGMRDRLIRATGIRTDASPSVAVEEVHRALARARCRLVSATLEDAMAVPERPNMPSVEGWPSWRLALPRPIESLESEPLPRTVAAALGSHGGGPQGRAP